MAENVLYFLADFDKYKQSKINLLSAKSNVLISREKVASLIELRTAEEKYRGKILKNISSLKYNLQKFGRNLPKPKEDILHEPVIEVETPKQKKDVKKLEKKSTKKRDDIKSELEAINQKLAELGAL